MTEESERMLTLLQELAALKDVESSGSRGDAAQRRKRRKEIGKEMKELASRKKQHK
jgi:hypothetical protein